MTTNLLISFDNEEFYMETVKESPFPLVVPPARKNDYDFSIVEFLTGKWLYSRISPRKFDYTSPVYSIFRVEIYYMYTRFCIAVFPSIVDFPLVI